MSRRSLSIIIGIFGFVSSLFFLLGMNVMGSLMADARTENIAGPGVDVFLLTPFPGPGDKVVLEVVARGGSRAGIRTVEVLHESSILARHHGRGATWGRYISGRKSRGSKSVTLSFQVPKGLKARDRLRCSIHVSYTVAMKSGHYFRNEEHTGQVRLNVPIYSQSGRRMAKTLEVGKALGLLLIWFLAIWGTGFLLTEADDENHQGAGASFESMGLLMGLLGGGFVGYWFFARPLMASLAATSTALAVVLTVLWVVVPVGAVWLWFKKRPKLARYHCTVRPRSDDVASAAVFGASSLVELAEQTARRLGYEPRRRSTGFSARKGKSRLRVIWSDRSMSRNELILEATQLREALELTHEMSGRAGIVALTTPGGDTIDVDHERTVDEIERAYTERIVERARKLLAGLEALGLSRPDVDSAQQDTEHPPPADR